MPIAVLFKTVRPLILTELSLTKHFFEYAQAAFGVRAEPEELQWHIPKRRLNIAAMLDSLLSSKSKVWQPLDVRFHELQSKIKQAISRKTEKWVDLKKDLARLYYLLHKLGR
jgi:hypothetical protein